MDLRRFVSSLYSAVRWQRQVQMCTCWAWWDLGGKANGLLDFGCWRLLDGGVPSAAKRSPSETRRTHQPHALGKARRKRIHKWNHGNHELQKWRNYANRTRYIFGDKFVLWSVPSDGGQRDSAFTGIVVNVKCFGGYQQDRREFLEHAPRHDAGSSNRDRLHQRVCSQERSSIRCAHAHQSCYCWSRQNERTPTKLNIHGKPRITLDTATRFCVLHQFLHDTQAVCSQAVEHQGAPFISPTSSCSAVMFPDHFLRTRGRKESIGWHHVQQLKLTIECSNEPCACIVYCGQIGRFILWHAWGMIDRIKDESKRFCGPKWLTCNGRWSCHVWDRMEITPLWLGLRPKYERNFCGSFRWLYTGPIFRCLQFQHET